MKKEVITIVAFQDGKTNSIAYKKFEDIEKAVEFYRRQLKKKEVKTISTRKCQIKTQH